MCYFCTPFEWLILVTICLNCIALGVYTPYPYSDSDDTNQILVSTPTLYNCVFAFKLIIKNIIFTYIPNEKLIIYFFQNPINKRIINILPKNSLIRVSKSQESLEIIIKNPLKAFFASYLLQKE